VVLQGVQLIVPPMTGQQLLVAALLQNFAVGQHDDVVRVLDGGKAVGNDQHGANGAHFFQRILNQKLGFGINVGGCFVQNHHAGLVDDRAGKAEQLALTGGEVVAALAHFLIQAVVQLVDEVVSVDIAADLHDLFVRDVILPQDNVAADGAGKEENILQHLSKMAAEGRNFDFADVDAVNQNFALLELVIAADEGQDGAFAGAGGTDKSHGFPRGNMERNALQHPFAGNIAEPDIAELNFAFYIGQLNGVGGIHQLGLNVHNRKDFFRRGQRGLQPVELLGQVLDGGKELGNVHVEGDDGAAGDGLPQERNVVQVAHAAQVEQAQNRADVQHVDQRAEYAEHKNLFLCDLGKGLAFLVELRHLFVLAAKNLGDLDTGKVLRKIGVDVSGGILDLTVGPAGKLAEDDSEDDDEGNKAEHHQGQLIVQAEHGHQNAQNDERIFDQVHQKVGEHHGNGVGIVGNAGNKLANRDLVELLVGEGLNVGEQILAQIGDDALADPLQNDRLKIGACHREHQNPRIDRDRSEQAAEGKIGGDKFFDRTDD